VKLNELIHKIFREKVGANSYTYVPPRKEEIMNLYHNLLDQIRNQSIDLCQLVYQITGDEKVRDEFKQLILGSPHDAHRILMFIESFHSAITMTGEDLVEEEHRLRLRLVELQQTKRDLTTCTMNDKQVGELDKLEEVFRDKIVSQTLTESKQVLVDGSKAKGEILEEEHNINRYKIQSENDKVELDQVITINAKDNIKSQILGFYTGKAAKHPEHIGLIEKELDIALKALHQIEFINPSKNMKNDNKE